jgi:hypothetical protein
MDVFPLMLCCLVALHSLIGVVRGSSYRHPQTGRYIPTAEVRHAPDPATGKTVPYILEEPSATAGAEVGVIGRDAATGRVMRALESQLEKMSKSKYNGVEPAIVLRQFGADTARLFMLSSAVTEKELDWNPRALLGMQAVGLCVRSFCCCCFCVDLTCDFVCSV